MMKHSSRNPQQNFTAEFTWTIWGKIHRFLLPSGSGNTLGTLFGLRELGSRRAPETPAGTLAWTLTLSGTLAGRSGPEGAERLP